MATMPTSNITDKMDDRSPLVPGEYVAAIVRSEVKTTKAGTGHYLALRFKVLEGDSRGRMVFTNLNYDNPNPIAVEIAFKALNSIKDACGLAPDEGEDTEELHGKPMTIKVAVRQGNAQYPPSNEITGYSPYDGDVEALHMETNNQPTAPTQKPWEKPSADAVPF